MEWNIPSKIHRGSASDKQNFAAGAWNVAETIIIGLEAKVLTAYTFIESQFESRDPLKSQKDLWIEPFIADKREWVK